MSKKKFWSTDRKGFYMVFENGYAASVQWGAGNYCDNHIPKDGDYSYSKDAESNTAEVAVFSSSGRMIDANQYVPESKRDVCDLFCGYLSPEDVVEFLCNVKNAK